MSPLETLANHLLAGRAPPFDWVVEHCPDGTLDAVWSRSSDTAAMEKIAIRVLDRPTYLDGVIAMSAPAIATARMTRVLAPFLAMIREWARDPQTRPTGDEDDPFRGLLKPAGDRLASATGASFRSLMMALASTARKRGNVIRYSSSTVTESLDYFWSSYAAQHGWYDQRSVRGRAHPRYAKTLRKHWPTPSIEQFLAPR